MIYSTDRPIETSNQDLLGRASFSKQLGKAIYSYNGQDGLVIGLFGKWGTGKTSVINMATSEIERLAKTDANKPLIMRFSPWNYSDKNNLISMFFQKLKNKIDLQDNEEVKKKVGKALSDYSGAFDALSVIPLVGSGLATFLKSFAKAQGDSLMQGTDLEETKKNLEKALLETNKKIVVVIDDIDRLTNSQIRDVFQLVKQVADFPNVIYVLAMDREVVRSALAEVHNIDGNEYLEKIIQIPFELPELKKARLHQIFEDKLYQIVQALPQEVVWDQIYWNDVFHNCVEPYIITLRDINRVINTFQFRYEMLYQETSLEDMVGITVLEVLEPELYKWIINNKSVVCGLSRQSDSSGGSDKNDYRKRYMDEFNQLGIDSKGAVNCISTMFPDFAELVGEKHKNRYETSSLYRGKMRVALEERFDLYFMFDLDEVKVSRNIINGCIYKYDRSTMLGTIKEIIERGFITFFLEEIRALKDNIPYERLGVIAGVLFEIPADSYLKNTTPDFDISAFGYVAVLAEDMIQQLRTEKERFEAISQIVKESSMDGLGNLTYVILDIEHSYGSFADSNVKIQSEYTISSEHLKEIEKDYLERIKHFANSDQLLSINGFVFVLILWEYLDKEGVEEFLSRIFSDEVKTLKFVCSLARRLKGTHSNSWYFYENSYSEYIPKDEVFDLIEKNVKTKLNEFSKIEQIKLASFYLNYNKDELHPVNEQKAGELVKEWQKNVPVSASMKDALDSGWKPHMVRS